MMLVTLQNVLFYRIGSRAVRPVSAPVLQASVLSLDIRVSRR